MLISILGSLIFFSFGLLASFPLEGYEAHESYKITEKTVPLAV